MNQTASISAMTRHHSKRRRRISPSLQRPTRIWWTKAKDLLFYVAIGAELIVPLVFYLGLVYGGGSQRVTSFIQGLMVWMTTSIFLWLVVDLFRRGFKE